MADASPTPWVLDTYKGTFQTWGELENAKWEDLELVLWDPGLVTVTVLLDIWDPVANTTLTPWDRDAINP